MERGLAVIIATTELRSGLCYDRWLHITNNVRIFRKFAIYVACGDADDTFHDYILMKLSMLLNRTRQRNMRYEMRASSRNRKTAMILIS